MRISQCQGKASKKASSISANEPLDPCIKTIGAFSRLSTSEASLRFKNGVLPFQHQQIPFWGYLRSTWETINNSWPTKPQL